MSKELELRTLNRAIQKGLDASTMQGFEKAYVLAEASSELEKALTPQYMAPIMGLMGTKLGFKTDRDTKGGYDQVVVKRCLIEAVLTGVNVVGNQFNIIAGNCYITKEGFGYLLKNIPGLNYSIIPGLPRINKENTSAAIEMEISWGFVEEKETRTIEFAIKLNNFMGVDAVIGKATRKARKWLYEQITGSELSDGDVQEVPYQEVSSKVGNKVKEELTPESEDWDEIKKAIKEGVHTIEEVKAKYRIDVSNEAKLLK